MAEACRAPTDNPGPRARPRSSARAGRTGATRSASTNTSGGFGLWVEQLIAESTGKEGKGLVPAPGESPDGPDRQRAEVELGDPYDLGAEFFRWEFATAVAGSILGINPFDQPNVQEAKDRTNEILGGGGDPGRRADRARWTSCSTGAEERDYVAIQAFVDPTDENERGSWRSSSVRARDRLRGHASASARATCTRPASCTRAARRPAASSRSSTTPATRSRSPGKDFGFGRLIRAQAAGDYAALQERGRPIVRVRLEDDLVKLGMVGLGPHGRAA